MKKLVSILLAVVLAFSALAVSVAAASEYQTYYMNLIEGENLKIIPANGYDQYVLPGEDFKFYVEVDEGYSDQFVIVEVDMVVIEPDIHGIYTVSEIDDDVEIEARLSMEQEQASLFSSLIMLVHDLMEWFKNIFESLFAFAA